MNDFQETPQGGYVVDLRVGDSAEVAARRVKLLAVHEPRGAARGTIRFPSVTLEVDGERAEAPAALYNMPQKISGVRVACSVTRGVVRAMGVHHDAHAMDADARIRVWPLTGSLFGPEPMVYPVRQNWFASMTQMANERTYVDNGEAPAAREDGYVYHHAGLDIGGHDTGPSILAARGGVAVCRGDETTPDYDEAKGGKARYDRLVIRDDADWHYRYAHLDMIALDVALGERVEAGRVIGVLGQQGSSGGWAHLHFSLCCEQPSGRFGEIDGYPFLVEAWLNEHPGALLACARPHRVAIVGETVALDGGNSICDGAEIASYRWDLHSGEVVNQARAEIVYEEEGMYSEMLTVVDSRGQSDVDFCVVQILSSDADPATTPPSMHLTYYPTTGIMPGQPVAFKARAFFKAGLEVNRAGEEHWDFGDGAVATTRSERAFAERWHTYDKPGRYIVTVRRVGANGLSAAAQLKVIVE